MYNFFVKKILRKIRPVSPHIPKDFDLFPLVFLQDFVSHFAGSMQFLGQKNVRRCAPKIDQNFPHKFNTNNQIFRLPNFTLRNFIRCQFPPLELKLWSELFLSRITTHIFFENNLWVAHTQLQLRRNLQLSIFLARPWFLLSWGFSHNFNSNMGLFQLKLFLFPPPEFSASGFLACP